MRISDWSSDVCSSDLLGVLEVLRGIFRPETLSRPQAVIIWDVRLPYTLMALVVGAALSLAGAEMPPILDTPLASPRSAERRVGKECVSTCGSRCSPDL